jgi:hypothetical protein
MRELFMCNIGMKAFDSKEGEFDREAHPAHERNGVFVVGAFRHIWQGSNRIVFGSISFTISGRTPNRKSLGAFHHYLAGLPTEYLLVRITTWVQTLPASR